MKLHEIIGLLCAFDPKDTVEIVTPSGSSRGAVEQLIVNLCSARDMFDPMDHAEVTITKVAP